MKALLLPVLSIALLLGCGTPPSWKEPLDEAESRLRANDCVGAVVAVKPILGKGKPPAEFQAQANRMGPEMRRCAAEVERRSKEDVAAIQRRWPELRKGMSPAEVHGIIGDPTTLSRLGLLSPEQLQQSIEAVTRTIRQKIDNRLYTLEFEDYKLVAWRLK